MLNKKKDLEIPVYLFMGFLEAGKTTFIQETLEEDYFNDGEKTLLFACEEGLTEYDPTLLERTNTTLVYVEEDDLCREFLIEKLVHYDPDRVIIEYNGMWLMDRLMAAIEDTPLMIFQSIVSVNAETFDLYMNNMRSLAVEMFKLAELVIINRCTKATPRATYRRSIKAVNRRAQVVFDSMVPGEDMGEEEEELPYDISGDEIHLEEEDYGIWFIDAMERPEVYDGKTIVMKARIFKAMRMPKGTFVPGRHAMTCCADDIQFIGYLCHTNHAKSSTIRSLKNKMWVTLTAEIRVEYLKEYQDKGPVLYAKRIEAADPPEEELVYF